jgi:hypothetical protein
MDTPNNSSYIILVEKISKFRKKYYNNEIIRGILITLAILLSTGLVFVVSEGSLRLNTTTRTILFWTFIATFIGIFSWFFIRPLAKLFQIAKGLNQYQIAKIIGKHFPEVDDKLLNTIQLNNQINAEKNDFSKSLLLASIQQKTDELKPISFTDAVNFKENRKYLKFLLIPLIIIITGIFLAPGVFLGGSERLMAYNQTFEEPAPFKFNLLNKDLNAISKENYLIQVELTGNKIPASVSLKLNDKEVLMNPSSKKNTFEYTLQNLQNPNYNFHFIANEFRSIDYNLVVKKRANFSKLTLIAKYPKYTQREDETFKNIGDISVPMGTQLQWQIETKDADFVNLRLDNTNLEATQRGKNEFTASSTIKKTINYSINVGNKNLNLIDSVAYKIAAIPDAFPTINIEREYDSTQLKALYFRGDVNDDYGFSNLTFNYKFTKTNNPLYANKVFKKSISINSKKLLQSFSYYWDFQELSINPGDELEYYFIVSDNDGINGAKSTQSQKFVFNAPTLKELQEKNEEKTAATQSSISNSISQSKELQKKIEETKLKLVNKRKLDWQDKKSIDDMLKDHNQLNEKIEDLVKDIQKNIEEQEQFNGVEQEVLEKQKKLKEMMEEMLDENSKKLMEEIKELLEQNSNENINQKLEELKKNDNEMLKNLSRLEELFKQLQFEQKLNDAIKDLEKIEEEQKNLQEKNEENKDVKDKQQKEEKNKKLAEEQEKLNKQFDEVRKKLDEMKEKNSKLERPNSLPTQLDQKEESIQQKMENSKENLNNNNNKKAGDQQEEARKEMQELKEKLEQLSRDMEEKQNEENYNDLRQILDNLIYVSFEQEKLINRLKDIRGYSPEFLEVSKAQKELRDQTKKIEDSLFSLSKRVVELKSFINKEIGEINFNMDKTIENLGKRRNYDAMEDQQTVMTSMNNLAVMLSEAMQQMQQKMQQQQKNKKDGKPNPNCKNPQEGEGKPNSKPKQGNKPGEEMQGLKEMQKKLGEELQKVKEGLQKGNQSGMSKELAKLAAQQEALRRMMQKLGEQLDKDAQGESKKINEQLKEIQEMMDKNEEDIVNKRVNEQTIKRQKNIEVRMLEAEKALRKQDTDEERKAEQGKTRFANNPPLLEKYLREKEKEVELLRMVPPDMQPYYKEKVRGYFQSK